MSRLRMDFLHCALLVAVVLLAVYAFGSFREGLHCAGLSKSKCKQRKGCWWAPGWAPSIGDKGSCYTPAEHEHFLLVGEAETYRQPFW